MNRSEQYWKWKTYLALLIALVLTILALSCGGNAAYGQKQVKDSTPVRIDFIIRVEKNELQKSMDSLMWVSSFLGQSMTVDNSIYLKGIQQRALGNILKNITTDTIPKPKK